MNDVDPRHDDLHLTANMHSGKPYHCDYCGDSYWPCKHWENEFPQETSMGQSEGDEK